MADHRPLAEIFADLRSGRGGDRPLGAEPTTQLSSEPADQLERALLGSLRRTLAAVDERATLDRTAGAMVRPDVQDIALRFAVDAESLLVELAATGASRLAAERSLDAVPAVSDAGVDAAAAALVGLAAAVADAAERVSPVGSAAAVGAVPGELLSTTAVRLLTVGVNAGYAAAARAVGLAPRQRFGDPYCPAVACYGQDARLLDESVVTKVGVPPYSADCNCTVVIG